MKMIVALRLPFHSLENIELKKWIHMAAFASSPPTLLSAKQLQQALNAQAIVSRDEVMQQLPLNALISTALNCWQSLNKYAFMVITGYIEIITMIIAIINLIFKYFINAD